MPDNPTCLESARSGRTLIRRFATPSPEGRRKGDPGPRYTKPMAGRIPERFIDELLTRIDIVDVIQERVTLKKAGRDRSARCPFDG